MVRMGRGPKRESQRMQQPCTDLRSETRFTYSGLGQATVQRLPVLTQDHRAHEGRGVRTAGSPAPPWRKGHTTRNWGAGGRPVQRGWGRRNECELRISEIQVRPTPCGPAIEDTVGF